MKPPLRHLVLAVLAILWFFVVVLPYYLYHRPFEGPNVLGVANTLGDLVVVALLLVLAASFGHRVLRGFVFESSLEALVIQTGVGYGILALVVFALGWVGLLLPLVFWILVVVGFGLMFRDAIAVWREVHSLVLVRATRPERLLSILLVLTLGIVLVFALTPPTGWDGLQYHLILPKLALQNGRFLPPPDNVSLSYPSLVEMLFLAAMGMKSDVAAQVVHSSFLVLLLGAVLVFAARYFTWRVGWLAAALLVAVPSILLISTYAYNDDALMLYTLLALFWALRAMETERTRDFVLAGALAGLAMGEKYTAFFVVVALGLDVLFQNGLKIPNGRAIGNALLMGAAAFVLAAPWYVRNYLLVGNPVYPFVFGGLYWDAWRAAWYSRFGTGLLGDPLQLLVVPWTATVQGFQGGEYDATIGALLLALLPFNLLPRGETTKKFVVRAMWVPVALLFAFWLLGIAESKLLWQTRLLFPVFPLLALLAAEGWERLGQIQLPQFSAQRFAALIIGLALGSSVVTSVLATLSARPLDVLVGIESRQEYLTRNLGAHYAMTQWVNANLPGNANIVALWEPRAYYIDRTIQPDAILDRFPHLQFLYNGDADAIAAAWKNAGYTHVLLYREGLNAMLGSGYDSVGAPEMTTLQALEEKHLKLVYGGAPLGLTTKDARPALENADTAPYAVYELK